jgi:hypothetical protein
MIRNKDIAGWTLYRAQEWWLTKSREWLAGYEKELRDGWLDVVQSSGIVVN